MDEDGNQCHKPIEDVKVGDMVWAYDEETGENAWKPVVRLFRNQTKEWYHVFVDGEEIVCTGGHPFYVAEIDKFIPARELKAGLKLLLSSGKCVTIEEIQVEQLSESETTYNFEVSDFHTYYISESNILVHNRCGKPQVQEYESKNAALRGAKRDAGISYNQEGRLLKTRVMENGRPKLLYEYTYKVGDDTIKIFEHTSHVFNDTGTMIQHHFHVSVNGIKSPIYYVWR